MPLRDAVNLSAVSCFNSLKSLYKQQYATKSNVQYARCYGRAMTDAGQVAPRVRSMAYYKGTGSSGDEVIVGYTYGYDGDGNIKTIKDLSATKLIAQYAYDAQNQLTNEYQYQADGTLDVHYRYDYDTAGNIQLVTVDGTVPLAVYKYEDSNWGDLLTSYNGKKIAYEGQTYSATANTVTGTATSGNPINWYNGTTYTNLTWQNGRQLASLQKGSNTYTYAYDMNSVRSSKTVNGVKHNYITQDGKVIREEYGTTVLEFVYDTNGAPYALRYRSNGGSWQTYYYVLNLQGDVVALLNEIGSVCARYTYNAWGEILSATNPSSSTVNIQDINPLRYRGYYYDTETGWYYLQSRYYDPIVKRFINADGYLSTGQGAIGHNMFAYCNNNAACLIDDSGTLCTHSTMVTDGGGRSKSKPVAKKGVVSERATAWTSYDRSFNKHGELYENWYENGKKVWSRHHSTHGNPKHHSNPHDHSWGRNKDGDWEQKPSQPVNPDFQPPDESNSDDQIAEEIADVASGLIVGYLIYEGAKWIAAAWLAPITGGGSLVVAGTTP